MLTLTVLDVLAAGKHMEKRTTIRDIAQALGVSIGTVDRALNDRPGVNPMTKARVLQMARTVGFKPNMAARFLSSKRRLRVSVNIPCEIASFWSLVHQGIQEEAAPFSASGLEVEFRTFPRFGSGEEDVFEDALQAQVHGIIAAVGHPDQMRPLIRKASHSRIPVICVATDAPGTERLAVVSIDPLVSGSLAGELLSRVIGGHGKLAVITGDLRISDHTEKHHAFRTAVRALFPAFTVLDAIENHEDEAEAYEKCRHLLQIHPDIRGIYISTANSEPVLRALEDAGGLGKVTVLATDLSAALVRRISRGDVVGSLYQRPRSQGRLAIRMLHSFLAEGQCPSYQVRLAPHVVMKSNLTFFLQQLSLQHEPLENNGNGEATHVASDKPVT